MGTQMKTPHWSKPAELSGSQKSGDGHPPMPERADFEPLDQWIERLTEIV